MMRNLSKNKEAAAEVISHDVTPLTVNTDARSYARFGWLIVLAGVLGFIVWAMLAPLDKGVPVSGTVTKEGNRKTVQHQSGGIIQDILVRDGDVVKAGQVLIRMNAVNATSQVAITQTQLIAARLAEARLMAEREGRSSVPFPASLEKYRNDPQTVSAYSVQQSLLTSRRSALSNELAAVDENIAGLRAQMKGLEESRDSKKSQLAILKEQLDNTRDLAKEGYIARNRLLDLERTYAQVAGAISEDIGNLGRSQRQIMELSLRRIQRQQEVQKEVGTQLADVQREADAQQGRLTALEFELANADVRSPVDGTVVGSSVFTKGGVVGAGARLMDVVPDADPFVVEGQLAVNLIDRVHRGLPVELVFSAFNSNKTPHIPATLTQVSADRTVDERTNQPYYKVRATVSPEGARLIAKNQLDIQPGMPVEMFVKTGERTMMSYLLKPLMDRSHSALSEE